MRTEEDEPVDSLGAYAAPRTSIGPTAAPPVVLRSAIGGALASAFTGVLAGVPYFVRFRLPVAMDWSVVIPVYVAFCVATGALVGLGVALGVRLADATWKRKRPLAAAIVGSVVGGGAAGVLPGMLGTVYFGTKNAPFMGTSVVAALPFVGVIVASAIIADVDARARDAGTASLGYAVGASILAALPFAVVCGFLVAVVDDETALGMFRAGADAATATYEDVRWSGLVRVGAIYGALLGAALGLHVGGTMALVRHGRRRVENEPTSFDVDRPE